MTAAIESWRYKKPFVISRCVLEEQMLLYASTELDGVMCQAEAEAAENDWSVAETIALRTRSELALATAHDAAYIATLPAGPMRNVLDCLNWDRRAKAAGCRAWELAGIDAAATVDTVFTVVLGEPDAMAAEAAHYASARSLKVKLGGGDIGEDIDRIEAVAAACPGGILLVDPNGAWVASELLRFMDAVRHLNIGLIEQPLAPNVDAALAGISSSIPICADESCTTVASLAGLVGRYQAINIKLDKTGGFTEAIAVAREARRLGFKVMTGCNGGTSLAIAPAFAIASMSDFVDLDGPLFLVKDRPHAMRFDGLTLHAPQPGLWG